MKKASSHHTKKSIIRESRREEEPEDIVSQAIMYLLMKEEVPRFMLREKVNHILGQRYSQKVMDRALSNMQSGMQISVEQDVCRLSEYASAHLPFRY